MEQQLADVIQTIFNDNGRVDPGVYNSFWRTVETNPQFVSCYLASLVAKMLSLETGMEKTTPLIKLLDLVNSSEEVMDIPKKPEMDEPTKILRESIVNTMNFLMQYADFDPNVPLLQKAQAKWTKYRAGKREYADEVVRNLSVKKTLDPSMALTLVEQCSNVTCAKGLGSAPPPLECPLSSKEMAPAVIHTFLRGLLSANTEVRAIFDNLLLFMKHPGIADGRMLSLMHMLLTFLRTNPQVDAEVLLAGTKLIKQFYLWPLPYSASAQAAMTLVTKEVVAPGSLLLEQVRERLPSPHVIVNSAAYYGRNFTDLISSQADVLPEGPHFQYQCVTTVLRAALGESDVSVDYGVGSCDDATIASLFDRLCAAASEANASEAEYETARASYVEAVQAIADDAKKKGTGERRFTSTHAPKFTLPLRLVSLNEKGLPTEQCGSTNLSSSLKNIPTVYAIDILSNILSSYSETATAENPQVVRIGVAGGDGTLHAVVVAYVALRHTKPSLFKHVDVRFYLVPLGARNTFASFLATYDGWYYRHSFSVPQTVLRVLPQCWGDPKSLEREVTWTLDTFGKMPEDPVQPVVPPSISRFPGAALKEEVENLFRHAHHTTPVTVFFCEITTKTGGTTNVRTIPFCHRVETGVSAYTRAFMRAKDCPPLMADEAVQSMKGYKFSAPEISLAFSEVTINGLSRPQAMEPSRGYWTVVASNAPRAGDRGVMPNPTQPWMELYALDAAGGKALSKGKSAVLDGERTWHVNAVEGEAKDTKDKSLFPVLIDGELFENVSKFKIYNCPDPIDSSKPLSVPIMSYLPINV